MLNFDSFQKTDDRREFVEVNNENAPELDNIFEEKLYVSKKAPFSDKTNLNRFRNKETLHEREAEEENEIGRHSSQIESEYIGIPKESTLQEIYDDVELRDVYKTREALQVENRKDPGLEQELAHAPPAENKKKVNGDNRVTFNERPISKESAIKNESPIIEETLKSSEAKTESEFASRKVKDLEAEFNLMIKTQKDSLKLKSKIYQFIYSELLAMRKDFQKQTGDLKAENQALKEEVAKLNEKVVKMKEAAAKHNQEISSRVQQWKTVIEKQVYDYLKKNQSK